MATYSVAQLRAVPTDQLIREHDAMAAGPIVVGVSYYLEELKRRDQAASERTIRNLTRVILGLTIANTVFVAIAALR